MPIAPVNIGTNGNSSGTTVAITVGVGGVPSACLIVAATYLIDNTASDGSITDTAGNTYVKIDRQNTNNNQGSGNLILWHVKNATALVSGNTITFTKTANNKDAAISAFYATGVDTSDPLDTDVTAKAGGSSTTPSVTSGVPNTTGEMIVYAVATRGNSGTFTQASGFATPFNEGSSGTGSSAARVDGGNLINVGVGTTTAAPTFGTTSVWAAIITGFKPPLDTLFAQSVM